jgi:hypothetical protein
MPMHAPTQRLAAPLQSYRRFSAITRSRRRGEDDEASVLLLTCGPRGQSHAQPTLPLAARGQGLDRVRRMRKCVTPVKKIF